MVVHSPGLPLLRLRPTRLRLRLRLLCLQYDKFNDVDFGRCSRVYCEGQALLPVGQSDIPRKFTVTLYCPRCNDIYYPKSSRHASEWR